MDHFEHIVLTLLEAEDYWVRQSYKVNLSKEEKRATGKPSIPRPEIDLLALNFARNEILMMEVKSFFDSPGVKLSDLQKVHQSAEGRYKFFTSEIYRKIVMQKLHEQLIEEGMANAKTKLNLGLAVGKVYQGKSEAVCTFMSSHKWLFWSPDDIKRKVTALAEQGYENNATVIAAKILLR